MSSEQASTQGAINFERPAPQASASNVVDHPGTLGEKFGTGKHAQTNIVLMVIRYSFWFAATICAIIAIYSWITKKDSILEPLKTVWSIFTPLITLSLGYLFGRGKE